MPLSTFGLRLGAVTLLFAPCLAVAVTFKVNNAELDLPDADPGDGSCRYSAVLDPNSNSLCTLRAAVMEANATPLDQEVNVELTPDATYTLQLGGADDNDAEVGDLDIKRPMTIGVPEGASQRALVDANQLSRAFHLHSLAENSTLRGIEITGGFVANGAGTAILSVVNNLTLTDLDVHGNMAGDIPGGAKCAVTADEATIFDSQIHSNGTPVNGVIGICGDNGGILTIVRSTVHNNWSAGISVLNNAGLFLVTSTVSSNELAGINIFDASATVLNSTIAFNRARQIHFHSASAGDYSLQIGGSLLQSGGLLDVCDTSDQHPDASASFTTGWNVYSDDSCISDTFVDNSLHNTSVELSELGNWGGPTPTHVPAVDSDAVDRAPADFCSAFGNTDQRGLPRPVAFSGNEARCDIGAVELQPSDNPDLIFSDSFEAL